MHDDHPEPGEPASRPQPKSAYELPSRKNTVLRNMVWALALTMAVVIVVGVGFFGVGSDMEREPLENSEVDVSASAERAADVAPFPVAVPELGEGWTVRSARFTEGEPASWVIRYSSPEGRLITLIEEPEIGAPLLSSTVPGASVEDEYQLEGAECSALRGGEQGTQQLALVCEGESFGVLVHGDAEQAELEELASAALASIG
ncbi:DUF4245 family protein [Brachybacterium sp.]|uniref:DUF4245 family protein n=1 Tax=Brachybacterium sp. TaxID=1891286 RepID=UPI002ED1ECD4